MDTPPRPLPQRERSSDHLRRMRSRPAGGDSLSRCFDAGRHPANPVGRDGIDAYERGIRSRAAQLAYREGNFSFEPIRL